MATTLLQLQTRVKQRTDNEHTSGEFVTSAELTQLINTSGQELHGLLVKCGIHQTEDVQTILANGMESYGLADDHFALLAAFRLDDTRRTPLERHDHKLRPDTTQTGLATSYRLMNESIQFNPTPVSGTYELVYIPKFVELSALTDELEGVNGWEEYIVIDASIRVMTKEQLDTSDLKQERERIYKRIQDEAVARDMSGSASIRARPRNEHGVTLDELDSRNGGWRYWTW